MTKKSSVQASATASRCGGEILLLILASCYWGTLNREQNAQQKQTKQTYVSDAPKLNLASVISKDRKTNFTNFQIAQIPTGNGQMLGWKFEFKIY